MYIVGGYVKKILFCNNSFRLNTCQWANIFFFKCLILMLWNHSTEWLLNIFLYWLSNWDILVDAYSFQHRPMPCSTLVSVQFKPKDTGIGRCKSINLSPLLNCSIVTLIIKVFIVSREKITKSCFLFPMSWII